MADVRVTIPALPAPTGASPQKAKFFQEVACAFELLALFYGLDSKAQSELNETLRGFAATAAARASGRVA